MPACLWSKGDEGLWRHSGCPSACTSSSYDVVHFEKMGKMFQKMGRGQKIGHDAVMCNVNYGKISLTMSRFTMPLTTVQY